MARSANMVIPEYTYFDGIRKLQDKIDVFNTATRGAITLDYEPSFLAANGGDYRKPVRFARPTSLDLHVDEALPSTADTPATFTQAKGSTVHQSRRALGAWTRDEVMRGIATPAEWSDAISTFIAEEKMKALVANMLGMGVAAVNAMDSPSNAYHVIDDTLGKVTGDKVKLTFARLNLLLNKMGDAREKIVTVVMHSAMFADLIADGLSNYVIENVAGNMIVRDVPQAFGRNILVIDSSKLYTELDSDYYAQYYCLGLAEGALGATIISEDPIDQDTTITNNVKSWTIRQDYDVEYSVQAMQWMTPGTHINPTDTELATAARWDPYLSDHREFGVVLGVYNIT